MVLLNKTKKNTRKEDISSNRITHYPLRNAFGLTKEKIKIYFSFRTKLRTENGFSFMEMVVAIGLFAVVMVGATQIFRLVLEGQRSAIASQNIQENVRYFFEVMSKEVRMATKSNDECESLYDDQPLAENKVYNVTTVNGEESLYFKNQKGECVAYYVSSSDVLMIKRDEHTASTTPDGLVVENVEFNVEDDAIGTYHDTQPRATILMEVSSERERMGYDKQMRLQSTISSRYYE